MIIENPPLDDDLLIHFGIKGMHWGHRKQRPDEEERKNTFQNADRARKIAIGIAVVGGAAAVAMLLSKRGRIKATDAVVTNFVMKRSAQSQAKANPFGQMARKLRETKAASVPSPDQMIAEARMAGVRNRFEKAGNQRLTDRTWRDQVKLSSLRRDLDSAPSGVINNHLEAQKTVRGRLGLLRRDMDETTNKLLQGNADALNAANARRNSA
jgi:hypothetical protein